MIVSELSHTHQCMQYASKIDVSSTAPVYSGGNATGMMVYSMLYLSMIIIITSRMSSQPKTHICVVSVLFSFISS